MQVPVVRVVWDNPEGFCEINESDFDPKVHKLYEEPKPAAEDKPVVESKSKK